MYFPANYPSTIDEKVINRILDSLLVGTYFRSIETRPHITSFEFCESQEHNILTSKVIVETTSKWWLNSKNCSEAFPLDKKQHSGEYEIFMASNLLDLSISSASATKDLLEITFEESTILSLVGDRETGCDDFGWTVKLNTLRDQSVCIASGIDMSGASVHPLFGGVLND